MEVAITLKEEIEVGLAYKSTVVYVDYLISGDCTGLIPSGCIAAKKKGQLLFYPIDKVIGTALVD